LSYGNYCNHLPLERNFQPCGIAHTRWRLFYVLQLIGKIDHELQILPEPNLDLLNDKRHNLSINSIFGDWDFEPG
jgi:hypothetical protein